MNKLILGNLVHRPLRSVISAFAVAIEVVMILSISAIMYGMLNNSRAGTSGIGMDMMTHPGASSALMNTTGASADIRVANVLRGLPHVKVVAPVYIKLTAGASLENIFGIDYASYNDLKPFVFKAGKPFEQPFDILIDDLQAASGKGTKVGDIVKVLNHEFRVCGIVEHGKGSRKFIPLSTMEQIDGNPGKASVFYLQTEASPKFEAAIIIGFMVIFQSMYTAVMERTREIGILKSMGAGPLGIVSVVLRETGLLALVGVLLGVGGTFALQASLHRKFPTLSFEISPRWIVTAVAIALAGALCGALYPAAKAARKDPIDALSYE